MADLSVCLLFFSTLLLPLLFFSLFLLLSVFHVALPLHSLWPILYFSASSFFLYIFCMIHIYVACTAPVMYIIEQQTQ